MPSDSMRALAKVSTGHPVSITANAMNNPLSSPHESSGPGRRFLIVDEDQLRQLIIQLSPDIRRDTDRMGDFIRELVTLEREKTGLDNPRGTLELWPNKEKKDPSHPDLIGTGRIAGRLYQATGWLSKANKVKIALLPRKRK
jgi:hypothetical protein